MLIHYADQEILPLMPEHKIIDGLENPTEKWVGLKLLSRDGEIHNPYGKKLKAYPHIVNCSDLQRTTKVSSLTIKSRTISLVRRLRTAVLDMGPGLPQTRGHRN